MLNIQASLTAKVYNLTKVAIDPMKQFNGAPLQRMVLKDRVAELIKEAIFSGKVEPGERIVEMKLASDLGVGTTAVREALFELEGQGFVSRLTNKGTFVTQLTAEDIEQIIPVRRELEGLAVQLVQERASEEDLARLDDLAAGMKSAAAEGDLKSFYRCDLDFHRSLWALSGNRHLAKALDMAIVPLFAFVIMKFPGSSTDLSKIAGKHAEIVRAIRSNKNARAYMDGVIERFAEDAREIVKQPATKST